MAKKKKTGKNVRKKIKIRGRQKSKGSKLSKVRKLIALSKKSRKRR